MFIRGKEKQLIENMANVWFGITVGILIANSTEDRVWLKWAAIASAGLFTLLAIALFVACRRAKGEAKQLG